MCIYNKVDKQKLNFKRRENLQVEGFWKAKECNIVTDILTVMMSVCEITEKWFLNFVLTEQWGL